MLSWSEHALDASSKENPGPYHTWLRMLRAHSLDLLGRRDDAAKEYQHIGFLPDFDGARERARGCLAEPCDRKVLLKLLRERSKN